MHTKLKIIILIGMIWTPSLWADGPWKRLDPATYAWPGSVPVTFPGSETYTWAQSRDMIEFNGEVFVGIRNSPSDGQNRVWKTTDFQTWTAVSMGDGTLYRIDKFEIHNNSLYAFGFGNDETNPKIPMIFRTQDGINWIDINLPDPNIIGNWSDAHSSNGYLFLSAEQNPEIWRTTGVGSPVTWEEKTFIDGALQFNLFNSRFIDFENELYVAFSRQPIPQYTGTNGDGIREFVHDFRIGKSQDNGDTWTRYSFDYRSTNQKVKHGFTIFNGELLYYNYDIFRLNPDQWVVAPEISFLKNFDLFTVGGQLHTKHSGDHDTNYDGGIYRHNTRNWISFQSHDYSDFSIHGVPIVTRANKSYILLGDIFEYENGVSDVASELFSVSPHISANSTHVKVLEFNVDVNFRDTIQQITVSNIGSAEESLEIQAVRLQHYSSFNHGTRQNYELEKSLDLRQWAYKQDIPNIVNGDRFEVYIDITRNPRENKTVEFVVHPGDIQWEINQDFIANANLVSSPPTLINVAGVNIINFNIPDSTSIYPSKQGVPIFDFNMTSNEPETLTGLTIWNLGTADFNDIEALRLYRKHNEIPGNELAVLRPGVNASTFSWTTDSNWPGIQLGASDEFVLAADISAQAQIGNTLRFAIPRSGFKFNINWDFSLTNDHIAPIETGITPFSLDLYPLTDELFYQGITQFDVLKFDIDFSQRVDLTDLKIENRGVDGLIVGDTTHDIDSLTLITNDGSSTLEIGTFTFDQTNNRWQFPTLNIENAQSYSYTIRMNLKSSARLYSSYKFAIPQNGVSFDGAPVQMESDLIETLDLILKPIGMDTLEIMPLETTSLTQGQREATILKFDAAFVVEENMKRFTVVNLGSGESGIDFNNVQLFRKLDEDAPVGLALSTTEKLADLIAEPDLKTWSTPSNFYHVMQPDVTYIITADIPPNARSDRSLHFSISPTGVEFEHNPDFTLPSNLSSGAELRIIQLAVGLESIPEVVVFPNPARDQVRFAYDLESNAHIQINIYDPTGALVSEITESKTNGQSVQTIWDATQKASGVYFAVIKIQPDSGGERLYKRKVYIKK